MTREPGDRPRVIDKEHAGFKRTGQWMIAEAILVVLLMLGVYLWKRFS